MEDTFTSLLGDDKKQKPKGSGDPSFAVNPVGGPGGPAPSQAGGQMPMVTAIHGAPDHVAGMIQTLHSGGLPQITSGQAPQSDVPALGTEGPSGPFQMPPVAPGSGTLMNQTTGQTFTAGGGRGGSRTPSNDSGASTNMFPSAPSSGGRRAMPDATAAAQQGMGIFNEALGEAKMGDRQRVGALALQDEQAGQKRAMENWMSAEGIRHHQQADDFYKDPAGANVFKSMYPGIDTSHINPGNHAIYDQGEKNRQARAGELQKGGGTMWLNETPGVPSPEHKAWNEAMGIPNPEVKAPIAPKVEEKVPYGAARAFTGSAATGAGTYGGAKLLSMLSKIPGADKIPGLKVILPIIGAAAGGFATEKGVEAVDPQMGKAREQHPFAGLLGALSPLAAHKGFQSYTGRSAPTPPNAAQASTLNQHANGQPQRGGVFPGNPTPPTTGVTGSSANPKVVPTPKPTIPVTTQFGPSGPVPIKQPGPTTPPPVGARPGAPSMSNVPTRPAQSPTSPTAAFGPRTPRPSLGAPSGPNVTTPLSQKENAILHDYFLRLGIPMKDATRGMSPDQLRQFISALNPP